jgi:hypothetical protein
VKRVTIRVELRVCEQMNEYFETEERMQARRGQAQRRPSR